MKILLFGIRGQVGSSVYHALKNSHLIHGVGRDEADFSDPASVLSVIRNFEPTCIINAAAYTDVDHAETDTTLCWQINASTVKEIARYCREHNITLFHFSTDYVFDGIQGEPYLESDTPNPINVYGHSKLAGERYIQESGCRHLIIRLSWVVSSTHPCFLNTMYELIQTRKKITVVKDQIGAPTSNQFIASVITMMFANLKSLDSGIYHLSCAGQTSWFQYAEFIVDHLHQSQSSFQVAEVVPILTNEYNTIANRPLNSVLNCNKLLNQIDAKRLEWKMDSAEQLSRMIENE